MAEICRFYGIIIRMYFYDHNPPHFHAYYGEFKALISISSLEIIDGFLPRKANELVRE